MDKKSVTTLTLKQINKHTVYQYIYRQRENFQVSDRAGSEHGPFHGQSESDHVGKNERG